MLATGALLSVFRYVNILRNAVYIPHPHLRDRHRYTITCVVTDNDQATATQTATIKVTSQASVAADVGLVSVAVLNGGCDKILYA
jgi:hypothetical protein